MKLVIISDTHNQYEQLDIPPCDVLISCGDYSSMGYKHEIAYFHRWLNKQPAEHIISVQGNHELGFESDPDTMMAVAKDECPKAHILEEGRVEINGVKFWGSAITPVFYDWAYNRTRGNNIKKHWDKIPEDTEVLITHGPPYGILDRITHDRVGCYDLLQRVKQLKQLRLHCFGHIHMDSGEIDINGVKFINAAVCNDENLVTHPIRIMEI